MSAGFSIPIDAFALATTGKTAAMVIPGATSTVIVVEFSISVAALTGRCLVELVESTQATAGTTTGTGAKQLYGFVAGDTTGPLATYGRKYSAEPTVLTMLKVWEFPCPGPLIIQFPLGREVQSLVSGSTKYKGIGLRCTVDTGTPNCNGYLHFEE